MILNRYPVVRPGGQVVCKIYHILKAGEVSLDAEHEQRRSSDEIPALDVTADAGPGAGDVAADAGPGAGA